MKVSEWLESKEYENDIVILSDKIKKQSSGPKNNSEATTANIVEKEIFHLVKVRTDTDLTFTKEKKIDGIKYKFVKKKRESGRGRLDTVVNDLIIEYKHCSKFINKKDQEIAIQQVKDYLYALKQRDNIEYDAILTDGIKICYFTFLDNSIQNTSIDTITKDDIDTIIKAVLANNTKKFVPSNILEDFSIDKKTQSISKSLAQTLMKEKQKQKEELNKIK